MAMLAEPRRRQKYSVDPNGTTWSNDDDKFGQRLMERMGWSKGKGLGAKEDGNVNHVAAKFKNDTRGLGSSKKHADNWIAHQDDFNALLSQLNSGTQDNEDTETKSAQVASLEARSKSAKGRVHYQKFTRGKDLSRAKQDDLDSIFGKRKSVSAPVTPQTQSEENSACNSETEQTENDQLLGVKTITSETSVQDYFAKKMALLKQKAGQGSGSSLQAFFASADRIATTFSTADGDAAANIESEIRQNARVRFVVGEESDKDTEDVETVEKRKKKKKSKKSKKSKYEKTDNAEDANHSEDPENICHEATDSTEMALDVDKHVPSDEVEVKKRKKKSKKSKECKSVDDVAMEGKLVENTSTEPANNDEVEQSRKRKKHKHKKSKNKDNCEEEEPKSKRRKCTKDEDGDADKVTANLLTNNECLDIDKSAAVSHGDETNCPVVSLQPTPGKKKKKLRLDNESKDSMKEVFTGSNILDIKGYGHNAHCYS